MGASLLTCDCAWAVPKNSARSTAARNALIVETRSIRIIKIASAADGRRHSDGIRVGQGPQGFCVRRAGDTSFCKNGGDVSGGRDVEGRVRGVNIRGDAYPLHVGHFGSSSLFDGDVVAIGDREIEGGNRGGDVKRNVVFFGEYRDLIGADLVGGVAVGGDAIRTGDDRADRAGLQKVAHHIVGDERERYAATMKLPGRKARALKIRASLGHEDVELVSLLNRDANHAQRGADTAGGQRAGV